MTARRTSIEDAARALRPSAVAAHDALLDHPIVHAYVSLRAFGDLTRDVAALAAEVRTRTGSGARVLCPGARRADRILELAAAVPDREIEVVDAAEHRIDALRAAAARCGLRNLIFVERDPSAPAEEGRYDVIACLYAVHAMRDLEGFWRGCARALRPSGVVLAEEYVGVPRFAWTPAQRSAGDEALRAIVPAGHRVHHDVVDGALATALCAGDPLLAARSDEILSTCRGAGFEIAGLAGAGCALLLPVLAGQIDSFDPQSWEHNSVLARLFRAEAALMAKGALGDAFAMFVARPGRAGEHGG